jgi:hypothetical protein
MATDIVHMYFHYSFLHVMISLALLLCVINVFTDSSDIPSFLSGRFEVFREENAPVILDVEEEQRKHIIKTDSSIKEFEEPSEEFQGVDLES